MAETQALLLSGQADKIVVKTALSLEEAKIAADHYSKGIAAAGSATADAVKHMAGIGAIAGIARAVSRAIDRMVDKIIDGFKSAALAAIDFLEDLERIKNIFVADGMGAVRMADTLVKDVAAAFGVASDEAAKLVAETADIAAGFGFDSKASLAFSEAVIKLGGDLASFQNIEGGVAEATERIASGVLGNTRNLRSLRIIVRKNDADFKAMLKTYMATNNLTKKQAEILTALTISYDQSRKAIGDFARTYDQAANQLRVFNSALREAKLQFGMAIVEALRLAEILHIMTSIVKEASNWWKEMDNDSKAAVIGMTAIVVVVLAVTSALSALTAVAAVVALALVALGPIAVPLAAIFGAILLVIDLLAAAFIGLIYYLGEGETVMARFGNGIRVFMEIIKSLVGFVANLSENMSILAYNLSVAFSAANGVLADFARNTAIVFGNILTMMTNIPEAIKAAMTDGMEAAKQALLKGTKELVDVQKGMNKKLASMQEFDLEFKMPKIFELTDFNKLKKQMTGTGSTVNAQLSTASIEGSIEAAKIISANARNDIVERNLMANERTATAAEKTAKNTEKKPPVTNL